MEKIQFTKGCPNNCSYCYEQKEIMELNPKIPKGRDCVQIQDMNFLSNPKAKEILSSLCGINKAYELVCGVDHRILDLKTIKLLKKANFIKIRWAWDYGFSQQSTHQKVYRLFLKAGYKPSNLSVFILTNWKTPFVDCMRKLQLMKVWRVKVNDCCYDGGYSQAKPHYWTIEQIQRFRRNSRKHNQIIIHNGYDPEICRYAI